MSIELLGLCGWCAVVSDEVGSCCWGFIAAAIYNRWVGELGVVILSEDDVDVIVDYWVFKIFLLCFLFLPSFSFCWIFSPIFLTFFFLTFFPTKKKMEVDGDKDWKIGKNISFEKMKEEDNGGIMECWRRWTLLVSLSSNTNLMMDNWGLWKMG